MHPNHSMYTCIPTALLATAVMSAQINELSKKGLYMIQLIMTCANVDAMLMTDVFTDAITT